MSEPPSVSIIIVNYNGKNIITDCLNTVIKTDYPSFEIVVVDNNSNDGSQRILKEKYKKQIKLVCTDKNLYFTGGSNLGALKANNQILVFLNSDTEVEPDWLKKLVACHLKNGRNSLIQPKILLYKNKKTIDNIGGKYIFPGFGKGMRKVGKIDYVNGTCFLIDKDFFFELGGFDDWFKMHYEDVDLNLRAQKQSSSVHYCPESIIYHKGSLTVKTKISKQELIYHIRKNRLKTVFKNFQGLNRILRLLCLAPFYLYWTVVQPITIKSIISFFRSLKRQPPA